MMKSWPWFKIEMETIVIQPHIKIFWFSKDSFTGYSERNKKRRKDRQKKRWDANIKGQTCIDFASSTRNQNEGVRDNCKVCGSLATLEDHGV